MAEYAARRNPNRPPMHPGALLRETALPATEKSISEIAKLLGVSRQTLHSILRESAPVTADMAVLLGKLLGNGPNLWLSLQRTYDLWYAEQKLAARVKKIPTLESASL